MDGAGRTSETALQHGASKRGRRATLAGLLRHEFVDVGGDSLVKRELLAIEAKANGDSVAVGKEPLAVHVTQVFFQAAQRPRTIFAKPEHFLEDLLRLLAKTVWFGKQVGINEAQEMRELVLVTMMRRGR